MPVWEERHEGDRWGLVGMAPGRREDAVGRPFVHKSGILLQEQVLDRLGYRRDQFRIDNAIKCYPPDDNLAQIRSWANKHKDKGYMDPVEACRPLLAQGLDGIDQVMALGAEAAHALSGSPKQITKYLGSSDKSLWGQQLYYNFHPSYVLRTPNTDEVFRDLFKKGMDWFLGQLPQVKIKGSLIKTLEDLEEAKRFFADKDWVSWDIETNLQIPRHLRCVGIGWVDSDKLIGRAFVVPYRNLLGKAQAAVKNPALGMAVAQYLRSIQHKLTGHNSGQFDRRVVLNELGVDIGTAEDTILLHLLVGNALPRNLGFLTTWLTPQLDAWKAEHTATKARSYRELLAYNMKDVVYQPLVRHKLRGQLAKRGSGHLLEKERALQWFGLQMQQIGMLVDMDETRKAEKHWSEQKLTALAELQEIVPDLNPGSHKQLHTLMFDKWRLPIVSVSEKTGQPSINDETLRVWVASDILDDEQYNAVMKLREFRKADKVLGTYLRPILTGELIDHRGKLIPAYNRLPASGRYSSSEPNAQNFPWYLKNLIVAPDGMALVGADQGAVEARMIAEEGGDETVIKIITDGADIHNESLEWVYGPEVWEIDGAPANRQKKGVENSDFDLARSRVKNVRYAFQYGAGLKTVRQQVGRVEMVVNGRLTFPFATMDLSDVRHIIDQLKEMSPALIKWWEQQEDFYALHGYIEESVWGRRRYFSHGAKLNDLSNHPIQSGSAALIQEVMFDLCGMSWLIDGTFREKSNFTFAPFGFYHGAGIGIMTQTHDSLVLVVPEDEAADWAVVLSEVNNRRTRKGLIAYQGEASVGRRWIEVK